MWQLSFHMFRAFFFISTLLFRFYVSTLCFDSLFRFFPNNFLVFCCQRIIENAPTLINIIITPASSTPSITAMTDDLKSISRMLAASVPVHAPVPGTGIPTKRSNAKNNPLPAFACSFLPPFSPFSKHQVKNFPITGLSAPQISTFLAKK